MSTCSRCDAEILWAKSATTGRPMPMNATPDPKGTFVIISGRARAATAEDDRLFRDRYTSHFSNCPAAGEFRRARG